MTAADLLAHLGKLANLGPLSLDGQGVCRLVFDGTTEVDLEPSPDAQAVHLHAALGPVPPDSGVPFFRMLLAGNLFGRDTAGNVLSFLPVERTVFLCRTTPLAGLDADEFAEDLTEFVRQARRWAAKIRLGPESAQPAEPGMVDFRNMVRV